MDELKKRKNILLCKSSSDDSFPTPVIDKVARIWEDNSELFDSHDLWFHMITLYMAVSDIRSETKNVYYMFWQNAEPGHHRFGSVSNVSVFGNVSWLPSDKIEKWKNVFNQLDFLGESCTRDRQRVWKLSSCSSRRYWQARISGHVRERCIQIVPHCALHFEKNRGRPTNR